MSVDSADRAFVRAVRRAEARELAALGPARRVPLGTAMRAVATELGLDIHRAAFYHEDSEDIEAAVGGDTEATDEAEDWREPSEADDEE